MLQSQRWVYGGLALVIVPLVVAGGVSSWLLWTPEGQIQQVRWQLESPWSHPLNRVDDGSVVSAALAFAKDGNSDKAWKLYKSYIDAPQSQTNYLGQYGELVVKLNPSGPGQEELNKARKAAEAITDPSSQVDALSQLAETATKVDPAAAKPLLQQVLKTAEAITDPYSQANALSQLAEAVATLADHEAAKPLLQQVLKAAEEANASGTLQKISEFYANQGLWKQALAALNKCGETEKIQPLTTILTRWAEKKQPTLIDGAVVLKVTPRGTPKAYTFEVEIQSPGNDCESYTDWWEVLRADTQTLVYRQFLSPKDQAKSPFTRTSDKPIDIQPEDEVIVRAHLYQNYGDQSEGYGAQQAWRGSVAKGFELIRSSPNFAARLADEDPQPSACADEGKPMAL